MAQQKITIDGVEIWQPDEDLGWSYETTYTSDSTRTQSGEGIFTEMFTSQSFSYSGSDIPAAEVAKLLKLIVGRKFTLSCWNPYFGKWMSATCYVGQGSLNIHTLEDGGERMSSVSFNMIDVHPLSWYQN